MGNKQQGHQAQEGGAPFDGRSWRLVSVQAAQGSMRPPGKEAGRGAGRHSGRRLWEDGEEEAGRRGEQLGLQEGRSRRAGPRARVTTGRALRHASRLAASGAAAWAPVWGRGRRGTWAAGGGAPRLPLRTTFFTRWPPDGIKPVSVA